MEEVELKEEEETNVLTREQSIGSTIRFGFRTSGSLMRMALIRESCLYLRPWQPLTLTTWMR
jgi:hypothetical protein